MKKYDLQAIMTKAWKIFRKVQVTFAEALHRAWLSAKAEEINQKRIEAARQAADVTEEVNSYNEWKKARVPGFTWSKSTFQCKVNLGEVMGIMQFIKHHSLGSHRCRR